MTETGPAPGALPGPDGLARCPWALSSADYLDYHDREWGRPVRDDAGMFERFSLEAFQSGLSWITILRKRDNFRAAFGGFDPAVVAAFGQADEARLLADPGIVRNRAKISAVIAQCPGGAGGSRRACRTCLAIRGRAGTGTRHAGRRAVVDPGIEGVRARAAGTWLRVRRPGHRLRDVSGVRGRR